MRHSEATRASSASIQRGKGLHDGKSKIHHVSKRDSRRAPGASAAVAGGVVILTPAKRAKAYIRDFGLRANFRAALHCGPVAIGELGTIKMEIAFLGDTMNTAARLQQACRDTGQRVLASAALVNRLAALPPGIAKRSIGRLRLRGKENEIELYALTAGVSAISAGGEITALSSRLG